VPSVGCAGLLVEDTFCGPVAALPPAGGLLLVDDMPVRAGGCAANVAIDLSRQGIAVDVAGCVGNDSAATALINNFARHGVGASQVIRVEGAATSRTVILLIEGQDRRYMHVAGANKAFAIERLSRQWLAQLQIFYLGGLFALPGIDLAELAALLSFCRANKITTVVDVVVPLEMRGMVQLRPLLPLIDVFVPNEDEARAFTGLTSPSDQLHSLSSAGANTVIITCGREGAIAYQKGKIWHCGSYQMAAVDPSGSGDAFTSGVIRSLLMGWGMPQALRYASAMGASATRASGTTDAVFSSAEAEIFVKENPMAVTAGA
jgi:sugar/nucleoside kinase (ribokinase family)